MFQDVLAELKTMLEKGWENGLDAMAAWENGFDFYILKGKGMFTFCLYHTKLKIGRFDIF